MKKRWEISSENRNLKYISRTEQNVISESKNLIYGFNRRLDKTEQMVSKWKNRSVKSIKFGK